MKRLNIEAEYTDIHLNPSIVDDMTTTLMNSLPGRGDIGFCRFINFFKSQPGSCVYCEVILEKVLGEMIAWKAILKGYASAGVAAIILLGLF